MEKAHEVEKIKNEEYKIWKKQSPFLYDICISKALRSPSKSVQWLPSSSISTAVSDDVFESSQLLLTSCELYGEHNSVYLTTVDLPGPAFSGKAETKSVVNPGRNKRVEFQPTMARYCPQKPYEVVGLSGTDGKVSIVNLADGSAHELAGHSGPVPSLSFNRHTPGLATAGCDGSIRLWDLEKMAEGSALIVDSPAQVNCVEFAPLNNDELASAGEDRTIRFWDYRSGGISRAITDSHATGVSALSYNPNNEFLLATSSGDGAIAVWDVRMSSASLAGLSSSPGPLNALAWSPHDESVLASGGADREVRIWDLSLHGVEQSVSEEQEGPPELIFIHAGHLGSVTDLSWHPVKPWTLASVSDDALVDIWQISSSIVM